MKIFNGSGFIEKKRRGGRNPPPPVRASVKGVFQITKVKVDKIDMEP